MVIAGVLRRVDTTVATLCAGGGLALSGAALAAWVARARQFRTRRESEAHYRLLFEANPHPMWVYDRDTLRFLAVNDAAVHTYGFRREEFLRMTIGDIRPEEDVPELENLLAGLAPGLNPSGVWRHRRKDGSILEVEIRSHSINFEGHNARLALATDVTERRRTEEALRVSEANYRHATRAALSAIWDFDVVRQRVAWGEGMGELFGHYPEEVDARLGWWEEHVHPDDFTRVMAVLKVALEGDATSWSDEYRFRRHDGTYAWIYDRGFVLRDETGRAVRMIGAMTDVSDRRRLEEQLQQAQKMEAVGRLAGGVAHDFNNLLTAILGFSEILMKALPPADERHEDAREIKRAALRAAELTRHLLAFGRKQMLQPRVLDLNATAGEIEALLRQLLGARIEFRLERDPDLGRVRADPGLVEQVIVNLVINARDAMPNGGQLTLRTANLNVVSGASDAETQLAPGSYVALMVIDTGVGMDSGTLQLIFEPFFTTKPKGVGTGLGLSTAYGIAKQSGGLITVQSAPGRGSTFTIYLPRVDEPLEGIRATPQTGLPLARSETVLVVEDEPAVLALSARALRAAGYAVLEAVRGPDALELAAGHPGPIELLVTDVFLPQLNGREVADRLRRSRPGLRVLYVSGFSDEVLGQGGPLEPGVAFLAKPFSTDALVRKVREVLDGSREGAVLRP